MTIMTQKPIWWEWVDTKRHCNEPIKLREDAPEDMKKQFEEWKKEKEIERAKGIWK